MYKIFFVIIISSSLFAGMPEKLKSITGDIVCIEENVTFGDRIVAITEVEKSSCKFDIANNKCIQLTLDHKDQKIELFGKLETTKDSLIATSWNSDKKEFEKENFIQITNKKGELTVGSLPYYFGGRSKMTCLIK